MLGYPNMTQDFENFEKPILEAFASRLPKLSAILLAQISAITKCEREFTGCGPCSTFTITDNCPIFDLGDDLSPVSYALSNIEFLSMGATVTLFFADSKIDILDFATFGEEVWPEGKIPYQFGINFC